MTRRPTGSWPATQIPARPEPCGSVRITCPVTLTGWTRTSSAADAGYVAFPGLGEQSQCLSMMDFTELSLGPHGHECHAQADGCPCALGNRAHCRGMMRYNEPLHLSSPAADALPADHVRLAASAYLARFTGSSREHTESELRCYLRWCADRGLDPLAARRPDLEQYIRWMQEN